MTNEKFKALYEDALTHGWVTSKDPTKAAEQKKKQQEYNHQYYLKNKEKFIGPINDLTHDPMIEASKLTYDARMRRRNKKQRKRKQVNTPELNVDFSIHSQLVKDTMERGKSIVDKIVNSFNPTPVDIKIDRKKSVKRADEAGKKMVEIYNDSVNRISSNILKTGKRVVNKILSR